MQWTEDTEDIISHETARTDYCKNVDISSLVEHGLRSAPTYTYDISSTLSIQLQLSTDKLAKKSFILYVYNFCVLSAVDVRVNIHTDDSR